MYALKNYGSMRLREWMFNIESASPATEELYSDWRAVLDGNKATEWNNITFRFDEYFQLAVLRAVTIVGISTKCWNRVFWGIADEVTPFQDVTRLYMQGVFDADWRFFAEKLASDLWYPNRYFPCVRPEWLFPYGHSQRCQPRNEMSAESRVRMSPD